EGLGNKFLGNVKESDAILHVVRCFEKGDVIHVSGSIDPKRDIEIIELELELADLDTVTKALDRVSKKARTGDKEATLQKAAYERAKEALEAGKPLRALSWSKPELEALRPLFL